jgi:hypothetical protein
MARRMGALWFGARNETDDHAVTHPVYADCLADVLTQRGHLTVTVPHTRPPHPAAQEAYRQAAITPDDQPLEAALIQRRHTAWEAGHARKPRHAQTASRRTRKDDQDRRPQRPVPPRPVQEQPPAPTQPVPQPPQQRGPHLTP